MSTAEQSKKRRDTLKHLKRCVICGKTDAYTLNGRACCAECCEKQKKYNQNINKEKAQQRKKSYTKKENLIIYVYIVEKHYLMITSILTVKNVELNLYKRVNEIIEKTEYFQEIQVCVITVKKSLR